MPWTLDTRLLMRDIYLCAALVCIALLFFAACWCIQCYWARHERPVLNEQLPQ